jgi:hypothetical protein
MLLVREVAGGWIGARLGNIYDLVIYYRRNISKDRLAVSNAVLKLALNTLISFNNVGLKVIALFYNEPLRITKGSFILTAYYWYCKEVVSYNC